MESEETLKQQFGKLEKELAAQRKINKVLMDRVERSVNDTGDAYSLFERNITLQKNVEIRTQELERTNAELHRMIDAANQAQDAAEHANRSKSTFLANMSHELRTPLNAIIGYSEMLREEADDVENRALSADLHKIHSSGKHLLGLINDILDLSKIEAGKMELYLESFDVSAMAEEVCATIRPLIEKNDNKLEIHKQGGLGEMHSDLTKVRQILFNLLSNACKFTANGTITLTLGRENNGAGEWLTLMVSDSGIGMTEEQIDRLFQPFTQADASTTKKYGGTGLGLTITQRFCEMIGGSIEVRSEHGKGSHFIVRLPPTMAQQKSDIQVIHGSTAHSRSDEDICTILVIDDDPMVCEMMHRYLDEDGFRVVTAHSGEEGIALARMLKPCAITLDVIMPAMDGWAVLNTLKLDPELADTPVIMMTFFDDKNMGYALGAADYLVKPLSKERLKTALNRHHRNCTNKHVLLVEDDPITREMTQRMLEKEGWLVSSADNGRRGLEQVAINAPELILLDLMMPEMDGFQFIDELAKHEEWRSIPVLVVTAKDLTDNDRRQLNGHVEQVLQKGAYRRDEMLKTVRELILTRRVCAATAVEPA